MKINTITDTTPMFHLICVLEDIVRIEHTAQRTQPAAAVNAVRLMVKEQYYLRELALIEHVWNTAQLAALGIKPCTLETFINNLNQSEVE